MVSLSEFISDLQFSFNDSRTRCNFENIVNKIVTNKSIQLWSITDENKAYERLHNLINGKLVNTLDVEKINPHLLSKSIACLKGQYSVIIIHDGSEIRKPESEQMENIGWVQSLDGKVIRGYKSFASVMIDNQTGTLKLLSCTPYSNRDPKFVSQVELADYQKGKIKCEERKKEIEKLFEAEDNYNSTKICKDQIQDIHNQIKRINPDIVINHVLDRGFDSTEIYEYIESLGDKYVIRSKSNRNSNEKINDENGNEIFLKLQQKTFENKQERIYEKVTFKNNTYLNAKAIFEWDTVVLVNALYYVLRIKFYTQDGKKIFKEPMMLITNYMVTDYEMALFTYQLYLQRPRIEGVFKFLKEVLGWETFRIQDYESIKNLIALTYYIGGYFYEIEDELIKDETVIWICKLGNGKGIVSRFYFMKGISKLLQAAEVEIFRKEYDISDEQIKKAYELIR